jgi:hypothetical protein
MPLRQDDNFNVVANAGPPFVRFVIHHKQNAIAASRIAGRESSRDPFGPASRHRMNVKEQGAF